MMDVFKILSRGASINRNKNSSVDHSTLVRKENETQHHRAEHLKHQVDRETDFFHTKKHAVLATEDTNEINQDSELNFPPLTISCEEDAKKLRKINNSKVTGDDIPFPIGSFDDLIGRFQIDRKLLANLIEAEFTEPTAIQCEAIPLTLKQRDIIACAPTGSGKTLAFLIPLIQTLIEEEKSGQKFLRGLIISPTNELAAQTFQQTQILGRGKGLNCALLTKKLAGKLSNDALNSLKIDLLVSTPLRLIEMVKRGCIDLSHVRELVIDEADKLFDRGFVGQIDELLSSCTYPKLRKSMYSATIPSGIETMAQSIMKDPIRVIIGLKEAASSNIEQKLVFAGNEEGKLLEIRQMIQNGEFRPPIIIFMQSITRAKALFHELIYDKLNVDVIHAERTPKQRDEVIRRFKSGNIWVLITTDVISRGVDFKGVNLVINYDVPQSAQAYVHRIGRTGRGNRKGKAVTFFTKEDIMLIKPIINVMKASGCQAGYSEWMENMEKLSKSNKKSIKTNQVERKQISTVPNVVRHKRRQKQEMIEASKKRKSESSIVNK
ncbi:uncharacterized protein PRCAT00001164001 [Priceomyces carsonii]|uniref:uncharacterized protein n=1 Tax=Priceomyces carsonii TaxID=28549 RepID=UPI002EDA2189|nr:unnamed protein product [Priceomyces carsonii]